MTLIHYSSAIGRGVLASALAFTFAAPAHAEPQGSGASKAKPDPAKKQRAEQHLKAGTAAFDRGEYELAITELKASYAEVPNPSLLYALGQAYRMSGDCAQAVDAYRAFLDSNPADKQREAATSNIERCEKSTPAPAAAAAAAPAQKTEAPPEEPVPTKADTASTPPPDEPPRDTKSWYEDVPGGILTGTGIAAAAVGTVLYIGGRGQVSDADAARSDADFRENRDDADAGLKQQKIGLIVLGAGGALITAGIIRYVTVGGSDTSSAHVRVGPTWGGVMATGAF